MNNGLDIKGLCKQIKADKNCMIWSLKNGIHSITNRKWMIDFDSVPREVKLLLLSIFGSQPDEGTCLSMSAYNYEPMNGVAVRGVNELINDHIPAKYTKFLVDQEKVGNLRIFKTDEYFVYIQETYLQAINKNIGFQNIGSVGAMAPLCFENINYIVLPVRVPKTDDLLTLKELTNE